MRFGSVFSGLGGFDLALTRAGMEPAWMVEKEPHAQRVLRRQFPDVPLYDDVTTVTCERLEADLGERARIDLLCGGWPCQDLSVAGRRAGLSGERSGLFFEFARLAAEFTPRWVLGENVPGLLSSVCPCPGDGACGGDEEFGVCVGKQHNVAGGVCEGGCMSAHGGAMGTVLGTLGELGYGFAYRVLDARYFGVAQRRRRVFIVGCAGDAASAAAVLLEPESCGGDLAPSRTPGARVADSLETRPTDARGRAGGISSLTETVSTLQGGTSARGHRNDAEGAAGGHIVVHPLTAEGHDASEDGTGRGTPLVVYPTLRSHIRNDSNPVTESTMLVITQRGRNGAAVPEIEASDVMPSLRTPGGGASQPVVMAPAFSKRPGQQIATREDGVSYALGTGPPPSVLNARQDPIVSDVAQPLDTDGNSQAVFGDVLGFDLSQITSKENGSNPKPGDPQPPLNLSAQATVPLSPEQGIRRLTPRECERLMNVPDDWTRWGDDGKELSDAARYRLCGNAVVVSVVEWIAGRLTQQEEP